jgi:predicted trehalose synthase
MPLPSPAALAAWLPAQRWFAGKTRRIDAVAIESVVALGSAVLLIARVRLDDGAEDRYALPLATQETPVDVLAEPAFARDLLRLMTTGARVSGDAGAIRGRPTAAGTPPLSDDEAVRRLGGEQSNTSVAFGDRIIFKQFRRLQTGINPEEEITRFLTERTPFRHAPKLIGSIAYEPVGREAATLAVAHEFVSGAEDGWRWTLAQLRDLDAHGEKSESPDAYPVSAAAASLAALRRLGERTGQLHVALESAPRDPDFAPEPIAPDDVRRWIDGLERELAAARAALGGQLPIEVPDASAALAGLIGATKIRQHGDFHLGQTLYVPARADFVIVDFEGEPLRPIAERRAKHPAMRDVAGLLRSISYAAAAERTPRSQRRRERWEAEGARAFVEGYLAAARGASFLPATPEAFERAVAAFALEKAAYEVVYEANQRPEWLPIPVQGLVSAAARIRARGSSAWA